MLFAWVDVRVRAGHDGHVRRHRPVRRGDGPGERRPFGGHPVDAVRLLQGALYRERQKCPDLAIFLLNALIVGFRESERGRLPFFQGGASGINAEGL